MIGRLQRQAWIVGLILFLSACTVTQQVKNGDTLYKEKQYTLAAGVLKKEFDAAADRPTRARKAFLIAECYRNAGQNAEAEPWYKQAHDLGYDDRALYLDGLMLKSEEKYQDALAAFNEYLQDEPYDEDARNQIEGCNLAIEWQAHPQPVDVKNVQELNSAAFDYAPALYVNNSLVFSSDRGSATGEKIYGWTGEKFSDLFVATKNANGTFSEPTLFESFNTPYNEGAACFSKDGTECYFTRCGGSNAVDNYCKIFYSQREGEVWSNPEPLKIFYDTCNVSQPGLSPDGKQLFFSSDADGGYGGKDLYVISKTDSGWSQPENLGPEVNSGGDEVFPTMADDGTLYFASNGLIGMGGLDLFSAKRINGQWAQVTNLQAPINSGADDFGMVLEKVNPNEKKDVHLKGYFVSNRTGGKGNDDIYSFSEKRVHIYLVKGDVVEKVFADSLNPNSDVVAFKALPEAQLSVALANQSDSSNVLKTLKSDQGGKFTFSADAEKSYDLIASKANYFTHSASVNTIGFSKKNEDTLVATVRLVLDRIYQNVQVNIHNIYYDYNKANIRSDAAVVLDTLATLLKENPGVKVEIGSHTDSRGSDSYNMRLSQARAQSVVDFLVQNGIDGSRLSAKGYGETQPVNGCVNGVPCTEDQYQANRRTTFKVTSETNIIQSTAPESIPQEKK